MSGVPENAEQRLRMINFGGQQSSSYAVEFVIEGAHIKIMMSYLLMKFYLKFFNLDEWLGVHGFSNIDVDFEKGWQFKS